MSQFNTLGTAAKALQRMHGDILYSEAFTKVDNICPFAAAHALAALAQLEQARFSLELAQLHVTRAIAHNQLERV